MKREPDPGALPVLAAQPIGLDVLREKYLKPGEATEQDLFRRVARALASVEAEPLRAEWEQRFFDNLNHGGIGAGRIMSAAGTTLQATLINCFVQPVGDCIQGTDDEGFPGIYEALREAAETMRRGGGVGYDFSRIRPRGAEVAATASLASGPCSYIDVFDHSCATVESAGARRGAQMGVLRIDHPDVLEFITAKRKPGRWNNFNVSVAVTDEFMRTLQAGGDWALVHRARPGAALVAQGAHVRADGLWVYRTVPARELWDTVMKSAYDFAEPGILFTDTINRENNLRYAERITATNPCVTADTRLATQHGLIPIGELQASGCAITATVDCRTLDGAERGVTTRPAKPAFQTAHRAPVFRVRTREGFEIKATAWHEFYTARGKIKLQDLAVGDELLVQSGKGQFGQVGTEDLGILLGLMTGDGHFTNRGGGEQAAVIDLWNEERLLADWVALRVNDAIAAFAGTRHSVSPIALPERNRVSIRSVILARVFEQYGFTRETKHRVPEAVWRGTEDCVRGYLRGLFQTDGTVNVSTSSQSCSIRLSSSKEDLLRDVQVLLANFGVFSRIHQRRAAGDRLLPNGRGELGTYACATNYELIVDGESRDRFMAEIGFLLPAKQQRYQDWVQGKALLKTQAFTARIESIEPLGEEPVFDTTQPDHNSVIFNGLVTGQCGEQPLPPYGCCDLGPVVLTRFVRYPFGFGGIPQFDFESFALAVATQVRALDNVLGLTHWPLEQQQAEARAKRRIGVGFTGLGDTLVMLGLRYDAPEGRDMAARIARSMRDTAYAASVELAKEKGAFPVFDADKYLEFGTFASRLDEPLKQAIRTHGIRNSHLLSIAPTGTVSLAFADNASNGIEPAFSWTYRRKKRESDGSTSEYDVEDHAWRLYRHLGGDVAHLPPYFVSALDMSAAGHLAMMQAVQPFIDTAISKTVNVPAEYPYEDFKGLYGEAWQAGLKGLATYRPNTILGAVLEVAPTGASEPEGAQAARVTADPMRAVIESRPQGSLPAVVEKIEYWTQQGQQRLYLVVSFLPLEDGRERAIEFFMPVGQSGESQQWITSSMRLLSLAARGGFLERALADMRKVAWDRGPVRLGTYARADGTQVPLWHDSEVAAIAYAVQNIISRRKGEPVAALETPEPAPVMATQQMAGRKCPECGAHAMIRKDGCDFCTQCGHVGTCG